MENIENVIRLESFISSTSSDIKSLTEKSNRYSQYMHTIEVYGDKINNLEEMQQRNESKFKTDITESINRTREELSVYVESKLEKFETVFKAQHREIEDKFVDINSDQKQISNELNTIQQNYDVQIQSINESAFIQNEDTFITKLNIIEEENKSNLEKILAMQEVSMIQEEKAKYVESLTSRVNQIDEMRQKSEAKAKEDFDFTASKNAKEIQELKLSLEQTMIQIEHYMKEENTAIKSENSSISKQVQVLREDASKQNQQLIQFLREKAELESKLEENIRESESVRKKGDSLRDTLANYEDIVDKKINKIQEDSKVSSKLLTDIVPKLNNMDKTIIHIEDKNKEQMSELKIELSNETKTFIESLRREVDGALVTNMEKIIEFEKDVQNLRKDNELSFSDHDNKIMNLLTATEEHSSFFEKVTSNISTIENKMTSYDQRQKAITENLLITSEAQLNEIRNKFDARISELIKRTDEHNDLFEQTEVKIVHMNDQSNKLEEDLFHTQRDVEELKKQGGNDRELVVLKIKEQKETLEAFFRSLEQKVETIETTQIKESSRVEIIERQTESQERLALQLESKIRDVERTAHQQVEEMGSELQEYVNHSREDLQNIRTDMTTDKENFWTLLVEIYSAFRGYTVVLKSEGAVKKHQSDVLGVYRMVDSYNDRPVYKQDGGENYIYYSSASNTWFVGTVVGQTAEKTIFTTVLHRIHGSWVQWWDTSMAGSGTDQRQQTQKDGSQTRAQDGNTDLWSAVQPPSDTIHGSVT